MLKWIKISGIILIIGIAGCTDDPEDDLKLPVRTEVTLGFLGEYMVQGYGGINEEGNQFQLTGCKLGIQNIEFEGIREAGDNVIFETDPAKKLAIIDLNGCSSTIIDIDFGGNPVLYFKGCNELVSEFDLPQGIYKYIRLDLYLSEISNEDIIDNVEVDSLNSGFCITGNFLHHSGNWEEYGGIDSITSYPLILMIESDEKFIFRSLQEVILKQPEREIFLALDIMDAFDHIDLKSIEEAEKMGKGKFQEIIISSKINRDLYEILLYRLGLRTTMILR